ncbi:MAG: DUF1559 domain-containing protein [Planctomycetaceae bacterium]|nr:DUF1559 domain-containing protein [Planctomycetaceae bacterium]
MRSPTPRRSAVTVHRHVLRSPHGACERCAAGFTVPELAVIVAVLFCGLALFAPYLLKLREASRQAECRERLRTLAVAVIGHHEAQQRFPEGQIARRSKANAIGRYADSEEARASDGAPASGASWIVAVLPHVDHQALFDRWDQKQSVLSNADVAQTELSFAYCPSRRGAVGGLGLAGACDRVSDGWTGGGNDYAACNGSGITFNDEARQTWDLDEMQLAATTRDGVCPYSSAANQRGLFGVNSRLTRSEVEAADGLANVLMLSERRVFHNAAPNEQHSSDGWAWGGPATSMSARFAPHTGAHYDEADSEHPGLVNVALADGRVRPVSWNIDLRTWTNLGNFASGIPIEHPEFRR